MKKVKWGVIGAGGIADRRTIPGMLLAENAEIVAVMEVTQEFADRLAEKYKVPYAYDCVEALLDNPDVEAVYIASPVSEHYTQVKLAALKGKHILLEKPLAVTSEQGEELVALCEKQEVLFAAGMMMRFHAYHQKAKEVVFSGIMGDIIIMRAQLSCWYPDIPGAWRQTKAISGGGSLMDMGIHCIDLLQFISGQEVTRVTAITATRTFNYEVEDTACALLEFKNGAIGFVDTCNNIPDNAVQGRLEVYGTKGSILTAGTIGQAEGGEFKLTLSDVEDYDAAQNRVQNEGATVDVTFGNMYTKEVESFGESILSDVPVAVPAAEALQVQKIIEKAYRSSAEGRFIAVP